MSFPTVWTVLLFTVALIHSSLSAAVLMKRQSGFGDRKPQIWSGPYPCFDKDGKMKFPPPKDPPWFTDDKCHMSICAGAMVITKSLCMLKGIVCPPGSYLAVPPKPSSPVDCCICKPYEPLK
ncbi:uncharacterized protein LOC114972425 [Acropora millepora]|uniref:uncharacterized protein LOC114972425 n=1 Tax=Acropora millepora TaxID=45264 RepID=UPI0010FCAE24|nr:uncharacterized protein LOC114972425 [Acropora millepora]